MREFSDYIVYVDESGDHGLLYRGQFRWSTAFRRSSGSENG
jgi:hypothetical protein